MSFIKGIARIGAAMLIGLTAQSAQAGYVVDLTQQGSDVVATGSGPIDLTGWVFIFSSTNPIGPINLWPAGAYLFTGSMSAGADGYLRNVIAGPSNFGSGGFTVADSGSGDLVGLDAVHFLSGVGLTSELYVPVGYVSDAPLSDTATYHNQTFNSLGVTRGTYEWTWGPGANLNFTLVIGTPEPSTWAMMLIGFAGLGVMGYRSAGRRLSRPALRRSRSATPLAS
jgi:hypothetical protein